VSFSEAEAERLATLAAARAAHDRRHGIRNQRVDQARTDAEVDAAAIAAHYAWCRALGAPFNAATSGTAQYLVRPPGQPYVLQSRASVHALGHVIFLPGEVIAGEVVGFGVPLTVGAGVHLVGWISRADYLRLASLRDFGIGPQPALGQAALAEPASLPGWIGPRAEPPNL